MNKAFLFLLILVLVASTARALSDEKITGPYLIWQRCLGGSSDDIATSIHQTSDGGYIVAGNTYSDDGDVNNKREGSDIWVVKLDSAGGIDWQSTFGGSNDDFAQAILQTADGGYIVAGYTFSDDGQVTGNNGGADYWVIKLDSTGGLVWEKCFGGSDDDYATSIQQTDDEGYVVAGTTRSRDGDVSHNFGHSDFWVIRLDRTGNLIWERSLGGSSNDFAQSVYKTADAGYVIAGLTRSTDGSVSGNKGEYDFWIVKLDAAGEFLWQNCLGGSFSDGAYSIQQTEDDGYIVAGYAYSDDGDVSRNNGGSDAWVVRLDSNGTMAWEKSIGGSENDFAQSIIQTDDGGFIAYCCTSSNDGDVRGNHGDYDFWLVKLDGEGGIIWQKCFGGTAEDIAYCAQQTSDGGYVVAGYTFSDDGDVSGHKGRADFWVIKLK